MVIEKGLNCKNFSKIFKKILKRQYNNYKYIYIYISVQNEELL